MQGGDGEPGYAGGYLRLFVTRDWVIKSGDGSQTWFDSSTEKGSGPVQGMPELSVQYRGGRGGDGQKGGHGEQGEAGKEGSNDAVRNNITSVDAGKTTREWVYDRAESAGMPGQIGATGAKGGSAGARGSISISSIVYAQEDKLDSWSRLALDLGEGNEQFGKTAAEGRGM